MDDRKTGSHFDSGDVRHSVDTVEERWRNESQRRRRLAIRFGLPIVVVLLAAWLIPAKIYRFFPFEKSIEEEQAEFEAMQKEAEAKKTPYVRKEGNEDAKMKICIVLWPRDEVAMGWSEVLNKAFDNRPSELFMEVWELDKLQNPEWIKLFKEKSNVGFVINGKHNFTYTNFRGQVKTYESVNNEPWALKDVDFAYILNSEYKRIYNTENDIYDLTHLTEAAMGDLMKKKNGPETVVTDESELTEEDKEDGSGSIVLPSFQLQLNDK